MRAAILFRSALVRAAAPWSTVVSDWRTWCFSVGGRHLLLFSVRDAHHLFICRPTEKKNKSLNLPLKTKNKTELLLRGGDIWAICLVSLATAQSRLHKVHKPTLNKHAYLSGKGWSWLDIRVNWRKFLKKWRSAE